MVHVALGSRRRLATRIRLAELYYPALQAPAALDFGGWARVAAFIATAPGTAAMNTAAAYPTSKFPAFRQDP